MGQPSVPIRLNPRGAYFLGLKIGRRSAEMVLTDFLGTILARRGLAYPVPAFDAVVDFAVQAAAHLVASLRPDAQARIAGLGIAYLPSFLYADAMSAGMVEEAIPELPIETQGIFAVYPPGRFTQPKVRAFIDFLVHSFADKGPDSW